MIVQPVLIVIDRTRGNLSLSVKLELRPHEDQFSQIGKVEVDLEEQAYLF